MARLLFGEGLPVAAHASAEDFLAALPADASGCLLLDLRLPGMSGLELQAELNRRGTRLPIVFLTGHGDVPASVRALKGGAFDFLEKPVPAETLLDRVHEALRLAAEQSRHAREDRAQTRRLERLTAREREVMLLAVAGNTSKAIAKQLGISHRTVELHRSRVMQKTGAANLIELARIAESGDPAAQEKKSP